MNDNEGAFLVRTARKAIETFLGEGRKISIPKNLEGRLREKRGVFVTVNKYEKGIKCLRGCIGFPMPDAPLINALIDAAISSAVEDPRFKPLSVNELPGLTIEVSVLTPMEPVKVDSPKDYPSKIRVGLDGLLMRWQLGSGLLLPQVASEYGWGSEEFLCQASLKAGGPPDLWLLPKTKIFTFQAEIFEEVEPNGRVIRKPM